MSVDLMDKYRWRTLGNVMRMPDVKDIKADETVSARNNILVTHAYLNWQYLGSGGCKYCNI